MLCSILNIVVTLRQRFAKFCFLGLRFLIFFQRNILLNRKCLSKKDLDKRSQASG